MPANPTYVGLAGIARVLCLLDRAYLAGPAIRVSDEVWLCWLAVT